MKRRLTDALLDECLVRIQAGEDIDACLAEYPELEPELRPLLEIALSLDGLHAVAPSPAFVDHAWSNIRVRLNEAAAAKPKRARFSLSFLNRQPVRTAASIMLALMLVATTALFFPGGPLSPQQTMAADCTLSVLSGSVTVRPENASTATARNGMGLTTGDTVQTGGDGYAVLTFANGSTLKLEPQTAVTLGQVTLTDDGATGDVVLQQTAGQTWSSVENVASGSSYMVMTPSAIAEVIGTQFVTSIGTGGETVVQTARGQVNVSAQGTTVSVSAGTQSQVSAGQTPEAATPTPPPKNQLTLVFTGSVAGSVTDPSGSSTGYLTDGFAFNQIPNSSSSSDESSQTISIPDPNSGEYQVLLNGVGDGQGNVSIEGTHLDNTVFSNLNVVPVKDGESYVITLQLSVNGDDFNISEVQSAQPAGNAAKPNVVVPPGLAKKDDDKTPPGQDDDKTPPGQDDGKTPPGQDDDKTPPGQDDGKTPPGQDENKKNTQGQAPNP